jgi:hypothetical protein
VLLQGLRLPVYSSSPFSHPKPVYFRKIGGRWERVAFGVLWAFFAGGLKKWVFFCVVFCGEVVVNCVVNRGRLMAVCAG